MKKQILALTACLVLTTTVTFANAPVKSGETKQIPAQIERQLPQANPCKFVAPCEMKFTPDQMKKHVEERMTKHRDKLYSKLELTAEQRTKAEELDKKNIEETKILINKINEEKTKLKNLQQKKACPCEICKQNRNLKSAQKALKKHFAASEKSFEALLTKEQLIKLKAIRKENRAKMQKHGNCLCPGHLYHKHHHHIPKFDTNESPMDK